jgi:hypothetical protein
MSILMILLIHIMFEILENTTAGMGIINTIKFRPSGKPTADSIINQTGDTISSIIGWYSAYYLDKIGESRG